jgi:hypothetical protein
MGYTVRGFMCVIFCLHASLALRLLASNYRYKSIVAKLIALRVPHENCVPCISLITEKKKYLKYKLVLLDPYLWYVQILIHSLIAGK